jgi:hypothetical protein
MRTQEKEDGLVMWADDGVGENADATICFDLSCDTAQCESTVLIFGKVDS